MKLLMYGSTTSLDKIVFHCSIGFFLNKTCRHKDVQPLYHTFRGKCQTVELSKYISISYISYMGSQVNTWHVPYYCRQICTWEMHAGTLPAFHMITYNILEQQTLPCLYIYICISELVCRIYFNR